MTYDPLQYEFITRRASYQCWLKFHTNRDELRLLCSLAHFLRHKGRVVVGKTEWLNNLTNNFKARQKMHGYFQGLLDRKLIGTFEYIQVPGSVCVGISELGLSVIRLYQSELTRLATQYGVHPYSVDSYAPPTVTAEPPVKYKRTA